MPITSTIEQLGRKNGRALAASVLALVCIAAPATAQTAAPQQQDEFRPISELPPQDQLPAAPLLISAYSVVLLALFFYILSIARRLGTVQREVERLEADVKRGRRG